MKPNNINTTTNTNLIGQDNFKQFLELQSVYGYAQRGGSVLLAKQKQQSRRLVNNVNILESAELKKLVFNEIIFGN